MKKTLFLKIITGYIITVVVTLLLGLLFIASAITVTFPYNGEILWLTNFTTAYLYTAATFCILTLLLVIFVAILVKFFPNRKILRFYEKN